MATKKNKNNSNLSTKKKSKPPSNKMNTDTRDSLSEFQSSIFDASDGHQLVDFIRKKKGLRAQPQKIFDDVPTNRQSLHIEIQRLEVPENNPKQSDPEEIENQASNENGSRTRSNGITSPGHAATLFKRLSQSIGRRTLLKEFEKTIQESRFLPPTCSTPLTVDHSSNQTNTMKDRTVNVNPGNLNIVCTPITVTDGESENRGSQTKETSRLAQELEQQVEFVLTPGSSERLMVHEECENDVEETLTNTSPQMRNNRRTYTIQRDNMSGNLILSPSRTLRSRTRNSTVLKTPERSTRANISKKLIVTPKQRELLLSKFGTPSLNTSSPVHGSNANNRVAQEINPCLASANLSQQPPETIKIIEEIQKKNTSNVPVIVIPVHQTFNQAPHHESPVTRMHMPESPTASNKMSSRILNPEHITSRRSNQVPNPDNITSPEPSPALNQEPITSRSQVRPQQKKLSTTFGRSPARPRNVASPASHTTAKTHHPPPVSSSSSSATYEPITTRSLVRPQEKNPSTTFDRSPARPRNVASPASHTTAKTHHPPPVSSSSSSSATNSPTKMDTLRMRDILTDDESSDYHPFYTQGRRPVTRKFRKTLNKAHSRPNLPQPVRPENKLSLKSRPSRNTSKVGDSQQLSRMSECEILDLRKRNSRGELCLKLTQRESSMLSRQLDLELLRRSKQDDKREEEILQMEVVAPPPSQFCDTSIQQFPSETTFAETEKFVDEMSGDKISLTRPDRLSQPKAKQKLGRKKKKLPEDMKLYLETSKNIRKSNLMNLSKRKLYSKGASEELSSVSVSKPKTPNQSIRRKTGKRKTSRIYSSPSLSPSSQSQSQSQLNQHQSMRSPSPQHQSMRSPSTKHQSRRSSSPQRRSRRSPSPPVQSRRSPSPPVQSRRSPSPPVQSRRSPSPQHTPIKNKSQDSVNRSAKAEEFLPQTNEVSEKAVKTKREAYKKKPKITVPPVDPDWKGSYVTANEQVCRRSKREKRLPMAYWSSTQTNFRPLYDYNVIAEKFTKKKKSTTKKNLVGNTKEVKGKNVDESKEQRSTKQKETEDDAGTHKQSNKNLSQKKPSKKNKKTNEKLVEQLTDDPSPDMTQDQPTESENEPPTVFEETTGSVFNHHHEPVASSMSSVQQVRLATIAEDTLPHVHPTSINSTVSSDSKTRLSSELMPPPSSVKFLRTKKSSSKANISRKNAFRTEHDKSIADVSPDHLNKLFDELKNSSIVNQQMHCSGQASADCPTIESNAVLERKCKKLAIRVPRLNVKKHSRQTKDKVCDSGFSSEDVVTISLNVLL